MVKLCFGILLGFCTCFILAACARTTKPAQPAASEVPFPDIITPLPGPSPLYTAYTVDQAFSANGPHLTPVQRQWIRKVATSRNYAPQRARLRFALVRYLRTPIVMWVDIAQAGERDRGGHIIGEWCGAYFDPVDRGTFAATGSSCSGPTWPPVQQHI